MARAVSAHRSPVDRILFWAMALLACALLAPPVHAADEIQSLVVKLRGDSLSVTDQGRLGSALGLPFTVGAQTRDGAFTLNLDQPADIDTVRAALNRVRLNAMVIYANVAPGAPVPDTTGLPTNRIIVKYRDPALVGNAQAGLSLDTGRIAQLTQVGGQSLAWVRGMHDGGNVLMMLQRLPVAQVEAVAARIAQDPEVDYAQPDYIRTAQLAPTDPCYASAGNGTCVGNYQWDLFDPVGGINMPAAWDITTGSASIFVSVIDTGALFNHPDLTGRFAGGYDMIADCAVANDGQPGPCTWSGADPNQTPDMASRDSDASDPGDWISSADNAGSGSAPPYHWLQGCPVGNSSWHGTHVSGTIGATPNNGIGIAGINWVSKIVMVRVLGKCGGYTSDIANAIVWAAGGNVPGVPANANPARVESISLGGGGSCDATSQNAITTATGLGTVVVVAAGNNNGNAANFSPASCNGVITVAATTKLGRRAYYSNWGATVEIAAPGGNNGVSDDPGILSSLNSGATSPASYIYANYSGTSMATPHVSGVVSLMLSANASLTPAQVLSKIQTTARTFPTPGPACNSPPQGAACNCTTALCGSGIIDAAAAVAAAGGGGGPGPTTTALASSQNPAPPGANVTFTATVTGTNPTGTVNFKDGGSTFGGCGAVALVGAGNSRTAQCATSSLALGVHSLTAVYSGDAGNQTSTSPALSQTIAKVASSTTLSGAPNPAPAGTQVTFTATVTGSGPTGTVNFKDGAASIAGCSAIAVSGAGNTRTATCLTSSLAQGVHAVAAVYSGDAGNNGSTSPNVFEMITAGGGTATTTTLVSSLNPSTFGGQITLTATVNGNLPTGTVNFKDGANSIAACNAQPLSGGGNSPQATCLVSSLTVGSHSLTAVYSGNAGNLASTSLSLTQTVNAAATTTTVISSLNPANLGQNVTFTATVNGVTPTGTVNFKDGASSIGACALRPLSGGGNGPQATCTVNNLTAGNHSITAVYSGDAGNLTSTSSPPLSQVINAGGGSPTTTTVISSLNPANAGQNVTFTATVNGTAAPTGTVNFKDGASSIGACTLQPLSGGGNSPQATCTVNNLTAGNHSITAVYSGDAGNLTSTSSPPLSQVINGAGPPPATVMMSSSRNPSPHGVPVLYAAIVTGAAPTGTVNFTDGAATIPGCGAVAVSGSGNTRSATCLATPVTVGTHSIKGSYSGDANNGAATSAPLSEVIQ